MIDSCAKVREVIKRPRGASGSGLAWPQFRAVATAGKSRTVLLSLMPSARKDVPGSKGWPQWSSRMPSMLAARGKPERLLGLPGAPQSQCKTAAGVSSPPTSSGILAPSEVITVRCSLPIDLSLLQGRPLLEGIRTRPVNGWGWGLTPPSMGGGAKPRGNVTAQGSGPVGDGGVPGTLRQQPWTIELLIPQDFDSVALFVHEFLLVHDALEERTNLAFKHSRVSDQLVSKVA
eukprot:CAMPEP_0172755130 /NCGR_PEP_ID=MMETSP1074-20121228/159285_1 /TAXON_ID=2916 /ORGANISM="Ceratium fusus, Strain PA161109" /LENGTH=231 /DNA_ID=CAMNT_0013588173 /DNA_START=125 /DNA_END=819 /DNA_ORIENTATION=-